MTDFHGVLTASDVMRTLFARIERVARTDSSVLIRGDTGTGKELVARAIHRLSRRAQGPYFAVNCAMWTGELLASELFGHVRGSFTGAVRARQGLFSLANGGTLFMDEVAELPIDIQARLLRVLQEQTFSPVGAVDPVLVDVRFVSATHRALREMVERQTFREDLMYRLRVVPIFLPRLAERDRDVEVLAWRFIDAFNERAERQIDAVAQEAMDAMMAYSWPGNVRELRNNIEHAFAVGEGPVLELEDLTPELRGEAPPGEGLPGSHADEVERARILEALQVSRGRRQLAARRLGMSRSTLWRRMRELGLDGVPDET